MRKALIELTTGMVVNIIEIEDGVNWQPSSGHKLIEAGNASLGDTWDGSKFVSRLPTAEELAIVAKEKKRREAKERAVIAIKANQAGTPWGKILMDLAVAQGLIEE